MGWDLFEKKYSVDLIMILYSIYTPPLVNPSETIYIHAPKYITNKKH